MLRDGCLACVFGPIGPAGRWPMNRSNPTKDPVLYAYCPYYSTRYSEYTMYVYTPVVQYSTVAK